MTETLVRAAYSLLLRLATPAYLARLWWRGAREPAYRKWLGERLAWRLGADGAAQPGALWLHAVSLGETRAAAALIDTLRAQQPGLRLLLTHGTATGRDAGRALLRDGDRQAWLPYDTPGAVRRFLRHHRPRVGVLMETEVWPNLLHVAQQAGVPLVLANARLSAKSFWKGQRLAALMHPALARFDAVLAQTEADAQRLRASGARNVQVLGNLKFDMTPAPALLVQGQAWRAQVQRPLVLAAVTRESEEAALLQAWKAVPKPRPLLLIVPRHPQRFDQVAELVSQAGFSLQRRSSWTNAPAAGALLSDVWLGDSTGEMPLYYASADVALLGGSFAPLGGQNLIEAAACGCPLVMGPHTYNFAQAADMAIAAGAAVRVKDMVEGVAAAIALVRDAAQRQTMSALASAFAAQHRGAARRMAQSIQMIKPPAGTDLAIECTGAVAANPSAATLFAVSSVHSPQTIPTDMQVWECQAYGGPEVLVRAKRPLPKPGKKQVLVHIEATTVETGDVRVRAQDMPRGMALIGRLVFGWRRPRQPVLGNVLAGTVLAVGPGVTRWSTGDRIVASLGAKGGAHAQWAVLNEGQAMVHRPASLTAQQAVAVVFGGLTAQYFLDRCAAQAGEQVLVIGATGSVGSALVQLAHARGAVVTALASQANLALARELGAARVLDYRQHPAPSLEAESFDVVADTCAASSFDECLPLLRPGGRYLNIAGDLPSMLVRGRQGRRNISGTGSETAQALAQVLQLAAGGVFKPVVDSTWPFAQLPAAHARAGSGHKRGCVVVQWLG